MRLKKFLRLAHLWLGLISGIVVFIVAITGCIYTFEEEIRSACYHDLYYNEGAGNQRLPLSDLQSLVKADFPKQKIRNVILPADENKNIVFNLKNKVAVYVDPYAGKVVGSIDRESEFLELNLKLHRSLCMGDPGKMITGISALIFLVMLITGIVLWWPKNRKTLHHKLRIKTASGKKRLFFDMHSVLGFYGSWVLIFSVLSGLIFSFKWAEKSMYFLAGSKKDEIKPRSQIISGKQKPNIGIMISDLQTQYPENEFFIGIPDDSTGTYRVSVTLDEGFLKKQDHYFFDQYTGDLVMEKHYAQQSAGEKIRANNLNIHTGKILGLPGKILVFLAGLIAASLPVTGFMMWRLKQKRHEVTSYTEDFSV